eukprot:Awhi_evm2s9135
MNVIAYAVVLYACCRIYYFKSQYKRDGNKEFYTLKCMKNGLVIFSLLVSFPLTFITKIINLVEASEAIEQGIECNFENSRWLSMVPFCLHIISISILAIFIWYRQFCICTSLVNQAERRKLVSFTFYSTLSFMIIFILILLPFAMVVSKNNIREFDCIFRVRVPSDSFLLCMWIAYNIIVTSLLIILGAFPLLIMKSIDVKIRYRGIILILCSVISLAATCLFAYVSTTRSKNGLPPTNFPEIFLSLDILTNALLIYVAAMPVGKLANLHQRIFPKADMPVEVVIDGIGSASSGRASRSREAELKDEIVKVERELQTLTGAKTADSDNCFILKQEKIVDIDIKLGSEMEDVKDKNLSLSLCPIASIEVNAFSDSNSDILYHRD